MNFKKLTKTVLALALVFTLALVIVGCEKKETNSGEDGPDPYAEMLTGGWNLYPYSIMDKMTVEELTEISEAMGDAADYLTPVIVIASQLVAGNNYAAIAIGDINSEYAGWNIVTYNVDLEGNPSLISIVPLDIENLKVVEDQQAEGVLGGWTVVDIEDSLLDEDVVQDAFDEAMEGYLGLDLVPVQLLAQQLVSGTNYMYMCVGAPTTENPVNSVYIVTVYEDLEGNAEVSSVEMLDLTKYIDN